MIIDFNDVNQDIIFFSAFRYCLGRQTYVVGAMVEEMIRNWSHTPISRRELFKKEIREAITKGWAGHDMDVVEWNKILALPDGEKGVSAKERGMMEKSFKKHIKAMKETMKK